MSRRQVAVAFRRAGARTLAASLLTTAAVALFAASSTQPPPAPAPADVARPREDPTSQLAHKELLAKAKSGRIDVYFAGDSIVRRWGATDYPELLANWRENFFGWNAGDFGWGADRTEHILWRLQNGELDGVRPKVIVLLAGTNNVGNTVRPDGHDAAAADIARGIKAILDVMRAKAPDATIILTAIFPRNDNIAVMPTIDRVNTIIAGFADGKAIRFLNVNAHLANARGELVDGVMHDKLHPTIKGYQIWADALKPILGDLLGPPAKTDLAPAPTGVPTAPQAPAGRAGGPPAVPGPAPSHADLEYAPAEPAGSNGHKLDLYLPTGSSQRLPVVVWTGGSAWMADTGKRTAPGIAAQLNPAGYAVAGVSIRSSSQIQFPGQLHDIKAAIRWLRANATKYNLDAERVAIMGDSSGGWTTAMAALTGDAPEMEGAVGTTGPSSKVQAAVAFYPPTNFLMMDAWALRKCGQPGCHDDATSPESRLVGCAIQTCPEKVQAANPLRYVTASDPPMMILHGGSDPLVPHNQGEQLYMALNKACLDATFISLPKAGHGPWNSFLTVDTIREAATIRTTVAAGCAVTNPLPFTPTWQTVVEFLDKHLKK